MAISKKYGRVTLENQRSVGDDEPVVVFRAKDKTLPHLLKIYYRLCWLAGSPQNHLDGIEDMRNTIEQWQSWHETQVPQSKGYDPKERNG